MKALNRIIATAGVAALAAGAHLVPARAATSTTASMTGSFVAGTTAQPNGSATTELVSRTITSADLGATVQMRITPDSTSKLDCNSLVLRYRVGTQTTSLTRDWTQSGCWTGGANLVTKITSAMVGSQVMLDAKASATAATGAMNYTGQSTVGGQVLSTKYSVSRPAAASATPAPTTAPAPTSSATPTAATTSTPQPTAAASTTATHSSLPVGISVTGTKLLFTTDSDRVAQLDALAASGARWLRVDIAGPQVSWDSSSQYYWTGLDKTVELARARGIQVLGVVGYLPVYARPAGSTMYYGPQTDAERTSFAQFAQKVAARYAGKVSAYEIWNEPNLASSWYPRPDAASYAKLFSVATTAIRGADPSATVVTGGLGGAGGSSTDVKASTFLQQVLAQVPAASLDGVAVHAYPNLSNQTAGEIGNLGTYRSLMDAAGLRSKKLWLTETGATTGTGTWATTEAGQAGFMDTAYRNMKAIHDAGPLFFYTLRDNSGAGTDPENAYGLMKADGTPKSAYRELQQVTSGKLG